MIINRKLTLERRPSLGAGVDGRVFIGLLQAKLRGAILNWANTCSFQVVFSAQITLKLSLV